MKLSLYQVDSFADTVFKGNPAAVCPLAEWLPDEVLQQIAAENNLSETAFYVPKEAAFEIRWFTPNMEVDLCGHATLATAYVLHRQEGYTGKLISFWSPRSGDLSVSIEDEVYTLDFPADVFAEVPLTDVLKRVTNQAPLAAYKGKTDYMLVFDSEAAIRDIVPDLSLMKQLDARGIIATARGVNADFVSRFFAPVAGINEDPVCGSAHTTMTPYWAKELGKERLHALQISARGGTLYCHAQGDRVTISGKAVLYLKGEIYI